ncbi:RbsD/FucU family protein [Vibrio sp. TH_r3]|uniref:RbsD/FucU family protein n=1 Tax=Vibrio sp. TH_r3 TaxID=3082084 RepID=UPI0029543101|nr:RbsD/FucU family protein [Vibrio sp. TH_r3]MDV7105356.1 RbsD/FucU family protein [Vibrio sp. TH_r3]
MLKSIDPILNPELLFSLSKMGHGDRLAIVDANFPSYSHCAFTHISLVGIDASTTLSTLLKYFPMDEFSDTPFFIMSQDNSPNLTESAKDFIKIQQNSDESDHQYKLVDRHIYYQMVRECQLVISTNDMRPYACMILQKGVIFD